MIEKLNKWLPIATAVVVVVILGILVGGKSQPLEVIVKVEYPSQEQNDLGGTRWPNGISADSTSPIAGQVRGTILTTTATGTIGGKFQTDNLFTRSPVAAATTTAGSTNVLVEKDLLDVGYHSVTPGGLVEGANMTYTFPASTTLTTFLDGVGEVATVCWWQTATTSSNRIIFAAGTGIDIEHASTTNTTSASALSIQSEEDVCFDFQREPTGNGTSLGNISAEINITADSD